MTPHDYEAEQVRRRELAAQRGRDHWARVRSLAEIVQLSPRRLQRLWSRIKHLEAAVLAGDQEALATLKTVVTDLFPVLPNDSDYRPLPPSEEEMQSRHKAARAIMRWAMRKIGDRDIARAAFEFVHKEG